MDRVLEQFLPAVARWFAETYAAPTPPQALGWPHIGAGENTLILSPTGSGKTLAAFLCAIDAAIRVEQSSECPAQGVHTLYLSPLKALANDIERNLVQPLAGIRASAQSLGETLPEIHVGVRTGDTPASERQKMLRTPPNILITTPESLNLLLTSPKARDMLRTVRHVIVDEIHAMCSNKRGTFLSLLLERLDTLVTKPLTRVGLSATQRPLDEIARFLGGQDESGDPRPVAIVDAGMRTSLDLEVQTPVEDMKVLPQEGNQSPSIWPAIYDRLIELVDEHESTLIFANSRRVVERIAAEMNRRFGYERVQAHHGSVSKERRHQIEQDLKEGRLPALVATSSMELGIDVGSIDLVCQVESPFSVASGLQRVGRAGHLVRATSKGRVIPKTRSDLLMSAAVSRAMLRGDISRVTIPRNPLDVLAQQVVAMVAVDDWDVEDLEHLVHRAYPYRDLPHEAFRSVLELVSGRFGSDDLPVLRPRVSWDRVNNRLEALPGTRHIAILNGGVIPDSGQYAMVLDDGRTRLGELDEEFVFERRLGDTFVLGTGQWRVLQITNDRVIVSPCDETEAMLPFWKGEGLGHDWEFGTRYGAFIRECESKLGEDSIIAWLQEECALDRNGATSLAEFLRDQGERGGTLPTDRRILVDVFRNEAGDDRLALISTYGRSFHLALLLLIQRTLRQMGHEPPEAVYSNVGLLFRLRELTPDAFMKALHSLRSETVEESLTQELENSPYFALRFRRNAGRALLLPRARPGRRTPLWLQRLRAHDLLAYASQQPRFPIVLETYRELLEDVLPVQGVRQFLDMVETGEADYALRRDRTPSPFSQPMLLDFTTTYLYLEDRPVGRGRSNTELQEDLGELLGHRVQADDVLDDAAIGTIEERLQGTASFHQARNGAELVELLRRIGDLTEPELLQRCTADVAQALPDLLADGRVIHVRIPESTQPLRLAAGEEAELFKHWTQDDVRYLVARYVAHHAFVKRQDVIDRYPASAALLDHIRQAQKWIDVELDDGTSGWAHPVVLASIRRMTMSRRRRLIEPASAEAYTRVLLDRHHVATRVQNDRLPDVMAQMSGYWLPVPAWFDVLASRVIGFHVEQLDELVRSGALIWSGRMSVGKQRLLGFRSPGMAGLNVQQRPAEQLDPLSQAVVRMLAEDGASFLHQITNALGEPPSVVAPLLWSLIWEGWVTNDSLDPAWGDAPQPQRWQGRRRHAAWGRGRWSLVEVSREPSEADIRQMLRHVLDQTGVLAREILNRSDVGITWRVAYPILTRMEWAGEVNRALFVSGLSGPQFACRDVSDALSHHSQSTEMVLLNVNDPVNVLGDLFPVLRPDGTRHIIRHHPGNYIVLQNGHPVLAIENRGERLIQLSDLTPPERAAAFKVLPRLVEGRHRSPSIRVASWDGAPVVDSPIEQELAQIGFVRENTAMILYRTFG